MITLRKGAIVGLGMLAGVGINAAQACDNDRFPCPVVSETVTQETAAAPAEPVQAAQPPKKAKQSAPPTTKPQPKAEQSTPRAKNSEAAPAARTTSKTAPLKQRTSPSPTNDLPSETAISASTIAQPPASDEPPKEVNQAMVAAAGAVWPTLPNIDSTPATTATNVEEATDQGGTVQINSGSVLTGNWSMFSYLSLILSSVLAVMAAFWLLPRMRVRAKSEVADEEELAASHYSSS
jgi:outer membrane biosynthesis protein TonB